MELQKQSRPKDGSKLLHARPFQIYKIPRSKRWYTHGGATVSNKKDPKIQKIRPWRCGVSNKKDPKKIQKICPWRCGVGKIHPQTRMLNAIIVLSKKQLVSHRNHHSTVITRASTYRGATAAGIIEGSTGFFGCWTDKAVFLPASNQDSRPYLS